MFVKSAFFFSIFLLNKLDSGRLLYIFLVIFIFYIICTSIKLGEEVVDTLFWSGSLFCEVEFWALTTGGLTIYGSKAKMTSYRSWVVYGNSVV